MTAFLLAALLLTAAVLLLILRPLLHPPQDPQDNTDGQHRAALAILREERARLQQDLDRGELTPQEHAAALAELEARALQDSQGADTLAAPARRAPALTFFLACAFPVLAVALYLTLGTPAALNPANLTPSPTAQHSGAPQLSREEFAAQLQTLIDRIAQDQIRDDPDTAWIMLARGLALLGDPTLIERAWQQLHTKLPTTTPGPLATWADLLAATRQGNFQGDPDRLLNLAFQLAPNDPGVLSLMGTSAYSRQEYAHAADLWQRLLPILPQTDPARPRLIESIQEARRLAQLPPLADLPAALSAPAMPQTATADAAQPAPAIRGTLRLDPALNDQVQPTDTVFLFLRRPGTPMPIAALKLTAAQLPYTFDFSQTALLTPGDLPPQLTLAARLTHSGQPIPQSGDLEGEITDLPSTGINGVQLTINRIRP